MRSMTSCVAVRDVESGVAVRDALQSTLRLLGMRLNMQFLDVWLQGTLGLHYLDFGLQGAHLDMHFVDFWSRCMHLDACSELRSFWLAHTIV